MQRVIPHNHEAEQGVLGSMLIQPGCIPEMVRRLKDDSFHHPANAELFALVVQMYHARIPADAVILTDKLRNTQRLDAIGGPAYITALYDTATAANAVYYADIVREKAQMRLIANASVALYKQVTSPAASVQEAAAMMSTLLSDLTTGDAGYKTMDEHMDDALDRYEKAYDNQGALPVGVVQTGLTEVDEALDAGFYPADFVVLAAETSGGKAQPLDSKVLTPSGFVPMGTLHVGDSVIGANGRATEVLGIFPQGNKEVFRVGFSDGSSTECCDEHLWLTHSWSQRAHHQSATVKSLRDIRKLVKLKHGARLNHQVPLTAPVFFEPGRALPLHPWLLGALLGDGCLTKNNIAFFNVEKDLQMRVADLLPSADTLVDEGDGLSFRIKRKRRNNKPSDTRIAIRDLGLYQANSTAKFIPAAYKYASPAERLELLQGLFDTDGSVKRGMSIDFVTCSHSLADDVEWIVQSLGGTAWRSIKQPSCTYKGEVSQGATAYRLGIKFPNDLVPISSQKNLAKWKGRSRGGGRLIESVESVGQKECQCILVAAKDHLYVTDDFIVTHNTALAMNAVCNASVLNQVASAVFSYEMKATQLVDRLVALQSKIPANKLRKGVFAEHEFARLSGTVAKMRKANIHLRDRIGKWSVDDVANEARAIKAKHGLGLVVVDYLQLMAPRPARNKQHNREREVAEMSRALKDLALELDIPVLALSQLNDDGKLRESRGLGHDADVVMTIENAYEAQDKKRRFPLEDERVIRINKNRSGKRDQAISVAWLGPLMQFSNL